MKEECLICGAPLVYFENETLMECSVCNKKEHSNCRCENGHYVCNECHISGVDKITGICLSSESKDPVKILNQLMSLPFCHMHGPEHHIMVACALLTAYKNAGGSLNLKEALSAAMSRGKNVPGGICGFWGSCGAGISCGIFVSVALGATPLKNKEWGLANQMTSKALAAIGELGGPRCCKRDSYTAIKQAVLFAKEKLQVNMQWEKPLCSFRKNNNQCIEGRCPYFNKGETQ